MLAGQSHKVAESIGHLLIKRYISKLKGVISFVNGSNVFSKDDKVSYLENLNSIKLNWEKFKGLDEL